MLIGVSIILNKVRFLTFYIMNIVLVSPPSEKILEKTDVPRYQHVGLGYLAAVLEQNGFNVRVVDAKLDRLNFAQTLKVINSLRPNVLGITAMTHEIDIAYRLVKNMKELVPGVFIIIGGVHLTALPLETFQRYQFFDLGILGEGEQSILEVMNLIEKKDFNFSDVKGVVYRKDSKVYVSKPRERIKALDALPFPAWSQFPNAREYIIITSRGCPFFCIFCMRALGREYRKRSADNVVQEIESVLSDRKPERFIFYDETFTADREHAYSICDLIIKNGLSRHIRWFATTRVDNVDKGLLIKMKEAGCNCIAFGVETGDENVMERIQKKITLEQVRRAVELAKKIGFRVEGNFILGHPNETLKTAYKTIHFAAELNLDIAPIGIMVPYPGTEIARLAREGAYGYKIISDEWSDYNKQFGNTLELEDLNRLDLERLQLVGYLKLFIFNRRFIALLRFMWDYKREMFSFLRNHLKKVKVYHKSQINILLMIKMIFSNSSELAHI